MLKYTALNLYRCRCRKIDYRIELCLCIASCRTFFFQNACVSTAVDGNLSGGMEAVHADCRAAAINDYVAIWVFCFCSICCRPQLYLCAIKQGNAIHAVLFCRIQSRSLYLAALHIQFTVYADYFYHGFVEIVSAFPSVIYHSCKLRDVRS